MPIQLGYWKLRGLAQPIRLLLAYTGEDWEDKFYECGPAPDYDRSCWTNEKHSLGLDFPNLPYLIDGDHKIAQSNAILRYIARKHDLCGKDEDARIRVDLVESQTVDFRTPFVTMCYRSANFAQDKEKYLKNIAGDLEAFSKFLGDHDFFAGSEVTYPDFMLYEALDHHRLLEPTILDEHENLKKFMARFEALPAIKAFMESDRFLKYPINNKMAQWGGK